MSQRCALLELPAELKNNIYHLALVQHTTIEVTAQGIPEPPLLSTAKQIRDEAIQIYYKQNKFRILVRDQNSDPLRKWTKKQASLYGSHQIIRPALTWNVLKEPHRHNLHKWLKDYRDLQLPFARSVPTQKERNRFSMEDMILGLMFNLVKNTRMVRWEKVEAMLAEYYHTLAVLDRGWREDVSG